MRKLGTFLVRGDSGGAVKTIGSDEVSLERRDLGVDEVVVRRVLLGETDLYEVVMRRHNRRLFRVARAILRIDDEAEDVMQDAYVRAYANLAQFHGDSSFATWLTRITVNEALARLRRRKKNASLEDEIGHEDDVMATSDRNPEQRAHDGELRTVLEDAIDALPPAFRAVFMMRAVEDMSTADAAAVLGVPEDTVRTRLFRARGLLQSMLAKRIEASAADAFSFERPRCDGVVAAVLGRIGPAAAK